MSEDTAIWVELEPGETIVAQAQWDDLEQRFDSLKQRFADLQDSVADSMQRIEALGTNPEELSRLSTQTREQP